MLQILPGCITLSLGGIRIPYLGKIDHDLFFQLGQRSCLLSAEENEELDCLRTFVTKAERNFELQEIVPNKILCESLSHILKIVSAVQVLCCYYLFAPLLHIEEKSSYVGVYFHFSGKEVTCYLLRGVYDSYCTLYNRVGQDVDCLERYVFPIFQ